MDGVGEVIKSELKALNPMRWYNLMNCEVRGVYKILRYRILTIDGEEYILDLWGSFWKIIFPFFFWMLPNPVFKVDDPNIAEKLKSPEVKQTKTRHSSMLGGGIGAFIATLLKPLADYFSIKATPLINSVILMIVVLFVFVLSLSINNMFKKKLYTIISLEELPMDKLWIRPKSIKHFFQVVVFYLFSLSLTILFFWISIFDPDVITLFFTIIALLFLWATSASPVTFGVTTVKFRSSKKTAV